MTCMYVADHNKLRSLRIIFALADLGMQEGLRNLPAL